MTDGGALEVVLAEQTMRAVVLREPRRLELVSVPRPRLTAPEHVLIEVRTCGICGSDLRYWAGENPWALHTLGRHVDNPPNLTLGHEFAGVVVAVNDARYEQLLGQRVGAQAFRTCGVCRLCRTGHENLCPSTLHIGHAQGWGEVDFYPGAYADTCLAWADLVFPMDDAVAFEEEALRDFLGVAVHAVGRADLRPGATVLCIGGGPVGLSIAQVALARGAAEVFVSDPAPVARDALARTAGVLKQRGGTPAGGSPGVRVVEGLAPSASMTTSAPHATQGTLVAIDPTQVALAEALAGRRCDAIFDTVGTPATTVEALTLLAEAGTYVNLAVHDAPLALNALALGSERRMTTSSNALYRDEREAHALIASRAVAMRPMITHRFPLTAFQEAYDLLLAEPKQAYKVVFVSGQV